MYFVSKLNCFNQQNNRQGERKLTFNQTKNFVAKYTFQSIIVYLRNKSSNYDMCV